MMPVTEKTSGFRLTGWHILAIFVGVFSVIFAVNAYMAYVATTTLRGLDVKNAYEKGVTYEKDVQAAQAQAERRWNVDIALRDGASPTQKVVTITAADKDATALSGIAATLVLAHPSDANKDRPIELTQTATGVFTGSFSADTGKWYLQLKLDQNGETRFRSRNAIKLE